MYMTFVGIEYLKSLNYHLNDPPPIKSCRNALIATFSKVILRKKLPFAILSNIITFSILKVGIFQV